MTSAAEGLDAPLGTDTGTGVRGETFSSRKSAPIQQGCFETAAGDTGLSGTTWPLLTWQVGNCLHSAASELQTGSIFG